MKLKTVAIAAAALALAVGMTACGGAASTAASSTAAAVGCCQGENKIICAVIPQPHREKTAGMSTI